MTDNNNIPERTLDYPDCSLPFFAYGIFKPGQLAYSKIRNHIKYAENVEINYKMKLRDGVPILINEKRNHSNTRGCILTFKEGHEEETYNIIRKTFLRKLYEWGTLEINGDKVNVVFGVNPEKGSNEIEYPEEKVSFDGKKDPLFTTALDLIETNLKSDMQPNEYEKLIPKNDEVSFLKLQMNFMLLWSAIDRYCSLKYNQPSLNSNYLKFAKQKAFKEGIKKFKDKNHRPVYSTDDLKFHEFNPENPVGTFYYYYTFRCNVVHKGKTLRVDYIRLKTATEELLAIFNDILKNTFDET